MKSLVSRKYCGASRSERGSPIPANRAVLTTAHALGIALLTRISGEWRILPTYILTRALLRCIHHRRLLQEDPWIHSVRDQTV